APISVSRSAARTGSLLVSEMGLPSGPYRMDRAAPCCPNRGLYSSASGSKYCGIGLPLTSTRIDLVLCATLLSPLSQVRDDLDVEVAAVRVCFPAAVRPLHLELGHEQSDPISVTGLERHEHPPDRRLDDLSLPVHHQLPA